ncbi:amidase [soil metagenome]
MRVLMALALVMASPAAAQSIEEKSIDELGAMMASGEASSAAITTRYLERIAAMNRQGPTLRAVIAINPDAKAEAAASDARRTGGTSLGPLDGVPILIKDNIETLDNATTAGSLALKDNFTRRDAPVVARLRAAGAVILGKANLSEWANIRSTRSMSGWSGVGGLVRNPYALDRSVCGSSSGSGAGVAASFAAAAVGSETDGSVVCPSSMTGLVGLKPTIGLVSRTHIVPISHSQDTAGPMARSVKDLAILFTAMVGADPADATTIDADIFKRDFAAGLSAGALKGVRVGVIRPEMSPDLTATYNSALAQLTAASALLIDVTPPKIDMGESELTVLLTELKVDLDAYLATTPATVTARTLDQLIAFDTTNAETEMPYFGQELFEKAAKTKGLADPDYLAARAKSLGLAKGALDAMMTAAGATILVEPTYGAAWLSDPVHGDQFTGPSASELPAISGYPHLTVPMGTVRGLPVGLSFIGPAHSDATLLNAGYAYEQQAKARVKPGYAARVEIR